MPNYSVSITSPNKTRIRYPYDITVDYTNDSGQDLRVFVYREYVTPPRPDPTGEGGSVSQPGPATKDSLGIETGKPTAGTVSETITSENPTPVILTITAMLQPPNAAGKNSPSFAVDIVTVTVLGPRLVTDTSS